jgi:hypothetical protein
MMLDQDQIVEALGKHLESIGDVVKWILLLALIFWWAGLHKEESIHALDITISRQQGVLVAVGAFLLANLIVFNRLVNIVNLLENVAADKVEKAFTALAVNQLLFNPFSFFGRSGLARWHCAGGLGILVLIWWLCASALCALVDNLFSWAALLFQGLFLLLGTMSIVSVFRALGLLADRLRDVKSDLYAPFEAMRLPRIIGFVLGFVGGALVAFVTQIARFL